MKSLNFKIIELSRKKQRRINLPIIAFLILLIPVYFSFKFESILIGIIIGCLAIGLVLYSFVIQNKSVRYNVIGVIIINEGFIFINKRRYPLESISSVNIIYRTFKGEPAKLPLLGVYNGDNNQISIEFYQSKNITLTFLSTSKNDFRWLNQILETYKSRGTNVNLIKKRSDEL